jgi:hypothetical protein
MAEYMMMSITCYEVRVVYLWFVSAQIHGADVSKYSVLFLSVLYCTSCSASSLWQCTDSVPPCNWLRVERLLTAILQKWYDYACFLYVHIHPTECD